MHTSLLFRCFLLLVWGWAVGPQHARASHAQAGQLTYQYVGTASNPHQYRVQLQFFRDCSGIPAPTSFTLNCSNTGCAGSATVTATMNQVGTPVIGQPYCTSQQANAICSLTTSAPPGSLDNFATYTYEATVTLPPAAEWVLSAEESARPSTANLSPGTFGTLRLEATLNNLIALSGGSTQGLVNSSPVFSTINLPVPFVPVNQESTVSFAATDPDRLNNGRADSLVYSLDRPLSGCNAFETYAAYPGTACVTGVDPRCASRIVRCNGLSASYSVTLPIPVANDTVRGACTPGTVTYADIRPRFLFNASSGSFTFTPNVFVPITSANPSSAGRNKYAVVGKVTEYRKINGRYYKVGSVRRDFLVIVIDGGNNLLPSNPPGTAGPPKSGVVLNITRDTTDITVQSCNYSRVRFSFTDPNNIPSSTNPNPVLQNLTVFFPADINTNLLQGGDIGSFVLTRNGTPNPIGTFFFQPSAALAGTVVLVNLRIEDDACPAKGIQYRTVRIRVVQGRRATATAGGAPSANVCLGTTLTLQGNVDRPDSVRSVATGQTIPQVYNYQWTTANGQQLPTVSNTQSISVTPTATTRYRLAVIPSIGFGTNGGGCGDTTSILVRVAPAPVVRFTVTPDSATSRNNAVNRLTLPPTTFTFVNQSSVSGGLRIDSTRWTYQRVQDGQLNTLATPDREVTFFRTTAANATASPPTPLTLTTPGGYIIRLRVFTNAGRTLSCSSGLARTRIFVPFVEIPNIITPNGDAKNDVFVVRAEQVGSKLEIYNRWGRKLQEYASYQNDWGGEGLPDGVYYYYLTEPSGGKTRGWVEIVRGQ